MVKAYSKLLLPLGLLGQVGAVALPQVADVGILANGIKDWLSPA
jgi:hypothetical protein